MTLYSNSAEAEGHGARHPITSEALNAAVAILHTFDTERLEKINEDETELINVINDLEMVKSLQNDREDLVMRNKSLAEFNLTLEPSLKQKKELLRELYVTQSEVFANFDGKKQTLEKNTGATSLDTILAILQSETATSDEASEELADQFLNETLPVEEFLTDFREKRKKTHMQRIKSEKFQEIISSGGAEIPGQNQPAQQQPQNNLNSTWNSSPSMARSGSLASPSRPAPPPPPQNVPYSQPQPYPVHNPAGGAPYWSTPQPAAIQTGPPPGSNLPYPMSQPYPQPANHAPRGGWGQGRAPYQTPPYMAMPQPHMPGYR